MRPPPVAAGRLAALQAQGDCAWLPGAGPQAAGPPACGFHSASIHGMCGPQPKREAGSGLSAVAVPARPALCLLCCHTHASALSKPSPPSAAIAASAGVDRQALPDLSPPARAAASAPAMRVLPRAAAALATVAWCMVVIGVNSRELRCLRFRCSVPAPPVPLPGAPASWVCVPLRDQSSLRCMPRPSGAVRLPLSRPPLPPVGARGHPPPLCAQRAVLPSAPRCRGRPSRHLPT